MQRGSARQLPGQTLRVVWRGRNTGVRTVIRSLDQEHQAGRPLDSPCRDDLRLLSTPVLDWESPYLGMLGDLKEYLRPDHKQLYLQGSRVEGYLAEIKPDEQIDLDFGAYPAIEALAFAVKALRDEARRWQQGQLYKDEPTAEYNPLSDWG